MSKNMDVAVAGNKASHAYSTSIEVPTPNRPRPTDTAYGVCGPASREHAAPTHAEICQLPGPQRIAWVNAVQVAYPRAEKILQKLEYYLARSMSNVAEPPCMLLAGRLGAGKSTITELLLANYPDERAAPTPQRPVAVAQRTVLRAILPISPNERDLPFCLLRAFGDPRANKGSAKELTWRLYDYIHDSGTRMVIVDELQHLIEANTLTILQSASDWLKNLAKQTGVSLVLVGLQGVSNMILEANEQLSSLFSDPITLDPFSWSDLSPKERGKPRDQWLVDGTREEFRRVLAQIERLLPLREASNLSDVGMAQRCYVASGGLMRYLMRLVREAACLALLRGQERLTQALLFEAFEQHVGGHYRSIANPFAPGTRLPEPVPLPPLPNYSLGRTHWGGALRILTSPSTTEAGDVSLRDYFSK